MKELFAKSKNGIEVYLDTERSHALTHFSHNPKLIEATKEVISDLNISGKIISTEKQMTEYAGDTDLVETNEEDEIVYALRPLRSIYSRFVKNKKSVPSKWVTIKIRKEKEMYILYTAFIGRLTPSFPGGNYLSDQSKVFWACHVLVWGSQEIIPGSKTDKCPW